MGRVTSFWGLVIGDLLGFGAWSLGFPYEGQTISRPRRNFIQGIHHCLARSDDVVLHVFPAAGGNDCVRLRARHRREAHGAGDS